MKKRFVAAVLGFSSVAGIDVAAAAEPVLELYVDTRTRQIYAGPGPGREKLGRFRQVDAATETSARLPTLSGAVPPDRSVPATPIMPIQAPVASHWYDKISLRGYVQMRYNHEIGGEAQQLSSPGDRFLGDKQSFGIRRARLVVSGQVSDRVFVYLQPDFASTPGGSSTSGFGQMRDAYADIKLDSQGEFRVRAGQSKVPYGWENLQSSQNRLAPDRADALNSGVRDERDLGVFVYYSPKVAAERFVDLTSSGLKGTGDYGVVGLGLYNGQGANRAEANNSQHAVVHLTWPFRFASGQYLEVGADAYTGKFVVATPTSVTMNGHTFTPRVDASAEGSTDRRIAVHAIYYPQPFGLQAEWTVGQGPQLDPATQSIRTKSLRGGYLQAMYRFQHASYGALMPYVKWQTYRGGSKFDTNAPRMRVDEVETGIEWQPSKAIEISLAYANMRRTDVKRTPYPSIRGDVVRVQLQWNY
jgi:hypothetical protein